MAETRLYLLLAALVCVFPLHACTDAGSRGQEPVFKQVPELVEIKPVKPVKIKLKRNASGSYSWELNGDDAEKILTIDRELKESLGQ